MTLTPAVFDLDVDAVVPAIERFVRDAMGDLARQGIVVPLSGGLDSSTVLALCARAVGPDRVTALLLPDRKGAPDALRFGRLVADRLGVRTAEVDTTRVNRAAGVYRFLGYRLPRLLVARIARSRLSGRDESPFVAGLRGTEDPLTRQALAAVNARQRLRMVVTYRYAEQRRLLVVGSAHKSEDLLGLFVQFGADDVADVMPLKGLYRSHILRIARVRADDLEDGAAVSAVLVRCAGRPVRATRACTCRSGRAVGAGPRPVAHRVRRLGRHRGAPGSGGGSFGRCRDGVAGRPARRVARADHARDTPVRRTTGPTADHRVARYGRLPEHQRRFRRRTTTPGRTCPC